jgi:hypothetical protein
MNESSRGEPAPREPERESRLTARSARASTNNRVDLADANLATIVEARDRALVAGKTG